MKNNSHSIIIIIFFVAILFFQLYAYGDNSNSTAVTNEISSREKFIYFSETGQKYYEYDKYETAEKFFQRALAIKPNDIDTLTKMGLVYMATGQFSPALQIFEKAVKLYPNDNNIENYRRDALWLLKVQQGDIPDLEHKLPIQATTAEGIKFYYDGKLIEAIEQFEISLKNVPYELRALVVGGHALAELERYDEAIAYYDRALEINPDEEGALTNKRTITDVLRQKNEGVPYTPIKPKVEPLKNQKFVDSDKIEKKSIPFDIIQKRSKKVSEMETIQYGKIGERLNVGKINQEIIQKITPSIIENDKYIDSSAEISNVESTTNFEKETKNIVIPDPASTATETLLCAGSLCFLKDDRVLDTGPIINYTVIVEPKIAKIVNYIIPNKVKNDAKSWIENDISTEEFFADFTYFSREQGQTKMITFELLGDSTKFDTKIIQNLVKTNVGWWKTGIISDGEFVQGTEYLIKKELIGFHVTIITKVIG